MGNQPGGTAMALGRAVHSPFSRLQNTSDAHDLDNCAFAWITVLTMKP
jgi:hypothetical protein